jgi:hypothetical protein
MTAGKRGPCRKCPSWSTPITKRQRLSLHPSVRFRCDPAKAGVQPPDNHKIGWCKELKAPTRDIDGCDDRPIAEIIKEARRKRAEKILIQKNLSW